MIDELLRALGASPDLSDVPTVVQMVVSIGLGFGLGLLIARAHRATHPGAGYAQSFAPTLVLVCVVTAAIMMVIGSNVARAFSLLGALSIIRFRASVKDPRDVGFVFFAMVTGMTLGVQLYGVAATATAAICAVVLLMTRLDVGAAPPAEALLRVAGTGIDPNGALGAALRARAEQGALIGIELLDDGRLELVYAVRVPDGAALLEALRAVPGVLELELLPGDRPS